MKALALITALMLFIAVLNMPYGRDKGIFIKSSCCSSKINLYPRLLVPPKPHPVQEVQVEKINRLSLNMATYGNYLPC
jgi:hypothetical protein